MNVEHKRHKKMMIAIATMPGGEGRGGEVGKYYITPPLS